jgi:hypothetical protein
MTQAKQEFYIVKQAEDIWLTATRDPGHPWCYGCTYDQWAATRFLTVEEYKKAIKSGLKYGSVNPSEHQLVKVTVIEEIL